MRPILLAAVLAAAPASAQVVAGAAPRDFVPAVEGAPVAAAPAQDAVLGVFEGQTDTLFWMQRDARAGLTSQTVQTYMHDHPQLGSRSVGDLLRAAGGGWMVLRNPATGQQHYAFLDGSVFYLPIPASARSGSAELPLAGVHPQGDRLVAVFGSPQAGGVTVKRYLPTRHGTEATTGAFSYRDGKLVDGAVSDADTLRLLLADPSVAPLQQALSAAADGGSALDRINAFLGGGAGRVVTLSVNGSGGALLKLRDGGKDTAYVYTQGGQARYLPLGH